MLVPSREVIFLCDVYPDEGDAYLKLTEGSGEIRAKEARRQLTAPASVKISKDSIVTDADAAAADAATSFADGKVVWHNVPLGNVLPLFNKYYAMNMEVSDKSLLTRPSDLHLDLGIRLEVEVPVRVPRSAALGADHDLRFAVLEVAQRHGAPLAARASRRRQEQHREAGDVRADPAARQPVEPTVDGLRDQEDEAHRRSSACSSRAAGPGPPSPNAPPSTATTGMTSRTAEDVNASSAPVSSGSG